MRVQFAKFPPKTGAILLRIAISRSFPKKTGAFLQKFLKKRLRKHPEARRNTIRRIYNGNGVKVFLIKRSKSGMAGTRNDVAENRAQTRTLQKRR